MPASVPIKDGGCAKICYCARRVSELASEKMTILSRPYNLCQHLRRKGVEIAAKLRITLCNACQHLRGCDDKIIEGFSNHVFITRVSICVLKFSRISRSSDFCL